MLYRSFLVFFFFCLAVFSAIFLYRFHFYPDFGNGFITGDWLINYEDGGFKRRGLSGTILFFIQDITHLKLTWIIYSIQLSLLILFLYNFLRLVWQKNISLFYITLV